jgi:uncharacterized protein involved in exopolysaccharide biosynthesis
MIEPDGIERSESGSGGGGGAWLINHLPTILWHRRLYMIVSFVLLFLVGLITAYTLPTIYRSSATLLIERQDLPEEIVDAPGTEQIELRIAKIREQVLSRGDLISLIEQNDLYASERRSQPMSEVVTKMRQSTTVGAQTGDIGSTPGKGNVIAIKMDFDYPDPVKAQTVMQAYVTQFMRMNSDQIEDQANLTVSFLQEQAQKLKAQVDVAEGRITALKASNGSVLIGGGGPTYADTGSYDAQIASLESQNRQLALQSSGGAADPELAAAQTALANAEAMYSDSHPDVALARERVAAIKRARPAGPTGLSPAAQEQIRSNNQTIAQLTASRNTAVARANVALSGQMRQPAILEQVMQLENQASGLREQYNTVLRNLMRAQATARLANEQRAERLSLVEPPNLPDTPHWPNRPLFILGGAAAGLGLGLVLALLVELLNRPMRSPNQLNSMGLPVLGVVPILQTNMPKKRFSFFRKRAKRFA